MRSELRQSQRKNFARAAPDVQIIAIDGTWRRDCALMDISESGVRLTVKGATAGLELKEFFLLLSSTGLAYRRCELVRLSGDEIGARFVRAKDKRA